jgi:hypothetical protein
VNRETRGKKTDGDLWPSANALTAWDDEVERRVAELVRRAVG